MKLIRSETTELTLWLSESQISILMACVRESFATLHAREYELRIGAPPQVASELAKELAALMRALGIDQ